MRNSLAADEDMSAPINHWQSLSGLPAGDVLPVGNQRVLDSVVVGHIFESLVNNQTTSTTESDSWPPQPPIVAIGFMRCLSQRVDSA